MFGTPKKARSGLLEKEPDLDLGFNWIANYSRQWSVSGTVLEYWFCLYLSEQ